MRIGDKQYCLYHAKKVGNEALKAAPKAKKEPIKRPPPKKFASKVKTALKGS